MTTIFDYVKDLWDLLRNRIPWMEGMIDNFNDYLRRDGKGIDTWIGWIYDFVARIDDITQDRLMHKNEGIDTWIGRIYDEVKNIGQPIVTVDITNILSQLANVQTSVQVGINTILSQFNEGILSLKADVENYITNGLASLKQDIDTMIQNAISTLSGLGDIDLSNLPQVFVEALTSSFDIDEEQLDEILEVRFPSG